MIQEDVKYYTVLEDSNTLQADVTVIAVLLILLTGIVYSENRKSCMGEMDGIGTKLLFIGVQ